MLKKFFASVVLSFIVSSVFAAPNFVILPNVNNTYLMSTNASIAIENQTKAIDVVKTTLNISDKSPYKTIRIRMIYNLQNKIEALIVYLLSTQYKSVELIRINLTSNWQVVSVINHYRMQTEDLAQSPALMAPHCPDKKVQFVIGNNFDGDASVEREVQRVYKAAKKKGYNPYLMNVNNPNGPQPTIQAYEDWMSCANVKGFYNESHGYEEGILLTDGDFMYSNVSTNLVNKLNHEVILFDSCLTFHNPLLDAMLNPSKGNTQQYVAGIISLPFGASERTARCFWLKALDHEALTEDLVKNCSIQEGLDPHGYGIGGNGDNHLTPAAVL